jgi:hypothetical protein
LKRSECGYYCEPSSRDKCHKHTRYLQKGALQQLSLQNCPYKFAPFAGKHLYFGRTATMICRSRLNSRTISLYQDDFAKTEPLDWIRGGLIRQLCVDRIIHDLEQHTCCNRRERERERERERQRERDTSTTAETEYFKGNFLCGI